MFPDPDHWLYRLDAPSWLRAAATELDAGAARLDARRTAITHARRAAGMALNAALIIYAETAEDPEAAAQRWGRSYLDHLRALAEGDPSLVAPLSPDLCSRARALLEIPPIVQPSGLVQLGAAPHTSARLALDLARSIVQACAALLPGHTVDPE